MKHIIVFFSLLLITQTHQSLCMKVEQKNNNKKTYKISNILEYLIIKHETTCNLCEKVETFIDAGVDVNQKIENTQCIHNGKNLLDLAVTNAQCKRCETLLRQKGAQETDYLRWVQKQRFFNKEID